MFAVKEYDRYVDLQTVSDSIFKDEGESPRQVEAQREADAAYQNWEYASGVKALDWH